VSGELLQVRFQYSGDIAWSKWFDGDIAHVHPHGRKVQVRVKPDFIPGYYRPKGRSGVHYGVSWYTSEPELSRLERVEVTPVDDVG